jgi:sulfur-oxidizing protein SoxY
LDRSPADKSADGERWARVRQSLFGNRPISTDAAGIVSLSAPLRAEDAAVVPIGIHTHLVQTPERFIRKLYLIIDNNPSPAGVTFTFGPESGRAEIETRVRVEEYSPVRAIAELNDGALFMDRHFLKASGGCSAPAGKDAAEALAKLGRIKLRVEGDVVPGEPVLAQLMISHPNISGLAIDQVTRLAPAPHFVRTIDVSYAGQQVLTADVDFTLSENPNIRFYFTPKSEGELHAEVIDTQDRRFDASLDVKAGPAAG